MTTLTLFDTAIGKKTYLTAGYVLINFWQFLQCGELSCSRLKIKVANKGQEPLHSSIIHSIKVLLTGINESAYNILQSGNDFSKAK